jgi:hypothetical protein
MGGLVIKEVFLPALETRQWVNTGLGFAPGASFQKVQRDSQEHHRYTIFRNPSSRFQSGQNAEANSESDIFNPEIRWGYQVGIANGQQN